MQIRVTGRHIDIGDALKSYADEKLASLEKHFYNIVDVSLVLSIDGHRHIAEVTANGSGIIVRGQAEGADLYAAIDGVEEKLIRQLDKYRGRLQKHRRRRMEQSAAYGEIPVQRTRDQVVEEKSLEDAPDDFYKDYMPKVIHQEVRDLQPMTVDEAVMQMDLMHTDFFIFVNPQTQLINVVYRRGNGTVGWIEPQVEAVAKTA